MQHPPDALLPHSMSSMISLDGSSGTGRSHRSVRLLSLSPKMSMLLFPASNRLCVHFSISQMISDARIPLNPRSTNIHKPQERALAGYWDLYRSKHRLTPPPLITFATTNQPSRAHTVNPPTESLALDGDALNTSGKKTTNISAYTPPNVFLSLVIANTRKVLMQATK